MPLFCVRDWFSAFHLLAAAVMVCDAHHAFTPAGTLRTAHPLNKLAHLAQSSRTTSKHNWTILQTSIILFLKSEGQVALTKQIYKTNEDETTLKTKSTIDYLDSLRVKHSTNCMVSTVDANCSFYAFLYLRSTFVPNVLFVPNFQAFVIPPSCVFMILYFVVFKWWK